MGPYSDAALHWQYATIAAPDLRQSSLLSQFVEMHVRVAVPLPPTHLHFAALSTVPELEIS